MRWLWIAPIAAALIITGGLVSTPKQQAENPLAAKGSVERLQERLRDSPADWRAWTTLGMSYLEQARSSGDPALYPKAQGAFEESLRHKHNDGALAGLGALANARHDFAKARQLAQEALALNGHSAQAVGVLVDAETQLGNADAASKAVQRMLDINPDLPALTRAAYDLELHGEVARAQELLQRALEATVDAGLTAYLHQLLGDLAWSVRDLATAKREYAGNPLGLARIAAAEGDHQTAIALMAQVTAQSPHHFIEYAQILRDAGRQSEADTQLTLADAALTLLEAAGGTDDLTAAELAIAQGKPDRAVEFATREWQRRKHTDVADTLAWSLHLAGRHSEALTYARKANALGNRSATYAHHLKLIEGASR